MRISIGIGRRVVLKVDLFESRVCHVKEPFLPVRARCAPGISDLPLLFVEADQPLRLQVLKVLAIAFSRLALAHALEPAVGEQGGNVTLKSLDSESLPLRAECKVGRHERAQEFVSFGIRAHASQRKGSQRSLRIRARPRLEPLQRWRRSTPNGPVGGLRPQPRASILTSQPVCFVADGKMSQALDVLVRGDNV